MQNDANWCDRSLYKVLFWGGVGHVAVGWGGVGHVGVGGSCRGGVGHAGVGWVM